ncbi:hypothetical protein H4217_005543 [Coemansia sp. RSA 1939]|nr:hypothetical protein H4217_005543 [Coemansia sp. RSA 1939]
MDAGSLVSFKNGKIVFSEKKLGLERHPSVVAAVFKFHQLISQLKEESNGSALPLKAIPSDHLPLLAMMVQERDVALGTLVKSIEMQLCPVVFGEESSRNSDILAHGAVEEAVRQIADHTNYGPSLRDLQSCCGEDLEDIPPSLSIQRWEVRDTSLLPADVRDVVERRRELRQSAHSECTQWFMSLDLDTRMQMLAGTLKKLKIKPQTVQSKETTRQGDSALATSKSVHTPRGQRSLQMFFGSEKTPDREKPTPVQRSMPRSYYEASFLPFHLRTNTKMYQYQTPASFDSSALDSILYHKATVSGSQPPTRESLLQKLRGMPRTLPLKHAPAVPVCEGVEIDEAEVRLQRLRQMPMKLFHFHGSRRPDYWGTWTRALFNVSGRRPFARAADQLDYDVDSDAEWEVEEEGEDLRSDDDEDDDEDDSDDDEDDEDFDEANGFVVGDRQPRHRLDPFATSADGSSDRESNDDSSDSEFNSEDEEIADINPEEEVCMDLMDVDEVDGSIDDSEVPSRTRKPSRRAARRQPPSNISKDDPQPKKRRQKVVPITPVVVGLLWNDMLLNASHQVEADSNSLAAANLALEALSKLTVAGISTDMPLSVDMNPQAVLHSKNDSPTGAPVRKGKAITDDDLFALASVVHGSCLGISKLVDEVKVCIPEATKAQLERLVHEHAVKEKRPPASRQMWYVNSDLVERARKTRKIRACGASTVEPTSIQDSDMEMSSFSEPTANAGEDAGLYFGNVCKRQRTDENN